MITVGRIKTILVKRVTKKLVSEHLEELSDDYNKNKEVLKKYLIIKSPKIRNVIAGYAGIRSRIDSPGTPIKSR